MRNYFDILARRVNDPVSGKQLLPECLLRIFGQWVHAEYFVARCNLYEAQLREIGLFTHKLGIDADMVMTGQARRHGVGLINKVVMGH